MHSPSPRKIEPRWPNVTAMLAVAGLNAALPSSLLLAGARWVTAFIIATLLIAILVAHYRNYHSLNEVLGYALNIVVTGALIVSLVLLIRAVTDHLITPSQLLRAAASLWIANILVFASWYWHLDGGGPHKRAMTPGHTDGAFLFPQMTMPSEVKTAAGEDDWEPKFVDYLFVAFNTSTAFSPTDVPVLSRWAKGLMMVQSLISLIVIALLAGRAVNIL